MTLVCGVRVTLCEHNKILMEIVKCSSCVDVMYVDMTHLCLVRSCFCSTGHGKAKSVEIGAPFSAAAAARILSQRPKVPLDWYGPCTLPDAKRGTRPSSIARDLNMQTWYGIGRTLPARGRPPRPWAGERGRRRESLTSPRAL